eukprot:1139749-Pelagomonas_calceolata.AAC.4
MYLEGVCLACPVRACASVQHWSWHLPLSAAAAAAAFLWVLAGRCTPSCAPVQASQWGTFSLLAFDHCNWSLWGKLNHQACLSKHHSGVNFSHLTLGKSTPSCVPVQVSQSSAFPVTQLQHCA